MAEQNLKLFINTAHKCASTMMHRIFSFVARESNLRFCLGFYKSDLKPWANIFMARNSHGENILFDESVINLIISRHPIGSSISKYYSFGWTHEVPHEYADHFIENVRKPIQEKSLIEFVKEDVSATVKHPNITLTNIVNKKELNHKYIFLPYELIISKKVNFYRIIKQVCNFNINISEEEFFKKFSKDFDPVEDKSEDIVQLQSTSHRRCSDPMEFKNKIPENVRKDILRDYPIIKEYEEILMKEKIITNL